MYVQGTCREMCPVKEREMREKEGILHKFELADNQETHQRFQNDTVSRGRGRHQVGFSGRRPKPKGDPDRIVKIFARSAAGLDKMVAEDLRPPDVLLRTVDYLCRQIILRDDPFNMIYDFVFDRLRSVRQDLVIQRIHDARAIQIYEIIIRFHVYAAFRLQDEPVDKFDPHINRKHLIDCLKRLICFYELNNFMGPTRDEFEALYVLATPETNDSILRAVEVRSKLGSLLFNKAMDASFAEKNGNYARLCSLMSYFPPIVATFFTQRIRNIRSGALAAMTVSYGVGNSKVPVLHIAKLLRYLTIAELIEDLKTVGAQVTFEDGNLPFAKFVKANVSLCFTKAALLSRGISNIGLDQLQGDTLDGRMYVARLLSPI